MLVPRRARTLRIDYAAELFPRRFSVNTNSSALSVSWDDILWAALTLGRPSLHDVFQHRDASYHEAIFRMSAVRMALEQRAPRGWRLFRTDAFKQLDPTEKGAVSYFLGMTFCKLFSALLLDTPWLLHLDVYRAQLGVVLMSRSRPDLIGQAAGIGAWRAFECKGRVSPPTNSDKAKAKAQARRLVSVGGTRCDLHIAAFTFFQRDQLQFYWRDPEAERDLRLPEPGDAWRFHYAPIVELLRQSGLQPSAEHQLFRVDAFDISAGIHPRIVKPLFEGDWAGAHALARELRTLFENDGYEPDGIAVRSGDSWAQRFKVTS